MKQVLIVVLILLVREINCAKKKKAEAKVEIGDPPVDWANQGVTEVDDEDGKHKILEGDIVLDHRELGQMEAWKHGKKGDIQHDASTTGKWPGAILPYDLSTTNGQQMTPSRMTKFKEAKQAIEASTCVRLVRRNENHRHFVEFIYGGGCYSYIGRVGGKQPLSIGRGCDHKSTWIHELMHALGFWHEQSRRDRNESITINWGNIPSAYHRQFAMYRVDQASTLGFAYDKQSVMHYSNYAFALNRRYKTIISKSDPNEILGNREGLSAIDIAQLNKHYACNGGGQQTTTVAATTALPATTAGPAEDKYGFCPLLDGVCDEYDFVKENCPQTCACASKRNRWRNTGSCKYWAGLTSNKEFCTKGRYIGWMIRNCAKSCCQAALL